MGSRVSVVEKRLDETNESLRTVDHVKDKLVQHSVDMKALNQKVADLSGLVGVEDRFKDLVQVTKVSTVFPTRQPNATGVSTSTSLQYRGLASVRYMSLLVHTKLQQTTSPHVKYLHQVQPAQRSVSSLY